MANFFGILKQEMYFGEPLMPYDQLEQKINKNINQYNNQRIKEKWNGMSPVEYRKHTVPLSA